MAWGVAKSVCGGSVLLVEYGQEKEKFPCLSINKAIDLTSTIIAITSNKAPLSAITSEKPASIHLAYLEPLTVTDTEEKDRKRDETATTVHEAANTLKNEAANTLKKLAEAANALKKLAEAANALKKLPEAANVLKKEAANTLKELAEAANTLKKLAEAAREKVETILGYIIDALFSVMKALDDVGRAYSIWVELISQKEMKKVKEKIPKSLKSTKALDDVWKAFNAKWFPELIRKTCAIERI